jgi:hypothetical protein
VAFSNQQSYIAAISARFVQLQHGDIDKRVGASPVCLCALFIRFSPGGGEAVRPRWPAVWRMPGSSLRRQIRPFLLRQRYLPAVLLWALLGTDPLTPRSRVPQTPRKGGGGSSARSALPLVLSCCWQGCLLG